MAVFSKEFFSETTNGEAIDVTATGSPGTVVHTAVNNGADLDEVWLYVSNRDVTKVTVIVEFGGTAEGNRIIEELDASKSMLIVPGIPLRGGAVVRVFAGNGQITAYGYVNRRVA